MSFDYADLQEWIGIERSSVDEDGSGEEKKPRRASAARKLLYSYIETAVLADDDEMSTENVLKMLKDLKEDEPD